MNIDNKISISWIGDGKNNIIAASNKCLLPLGNETVISHVIKRARVAGIEPIVCTSTDPSDDILAEIASELGAQC